jgi:alpha-L-fucosidase
MKHALTKAAVLFTLAGCLRGNLDVIERQPSADGGGMDSDGDTLALDGGVDTGLPPTPNLEDLQRAYIDLRFGMLIHFGILTYTGNWADANLRIDEFNPTKLDAAQWAKAAVAAKMKYAILSVRHIDGFALWNTATTTFDVGAIGWKNGTGDVVKEFVDAFRAQGLKVGFLYPMWDATQGIGNSGVGNTTITPPQLQYLKAQLTELLSNYGTISFLHFTAWAWQMGHHALPYEEIRELVKSHQPTCLIFDQTQLMNLWDVDATVYEESWGMTPPVDNTLPSTLMQKINSSGGNNWFWDTSIDGLMTATDIVQNLQTLEGRYANFLLNIPPNRDGLLDSSMVATLTQVGSAWNPDVTRKPLPAQGPQNEHPYRPVSASATSGNAFNAIDGVDTYNGYTVWQSSGNLPQSITLDLGVERTDVGILTYVPLYTGRESPSIDGAITSYAILTSRNDNNFTVATTGTWLLNTAMKTAVFPPVTARYVRLEVRAANGNSAAATEITVGARR